MYGESFCDPMSLVMRPPRRGPMTIDDRWPMYGERFRDHISLVIGPTRRGPLTIDDQWIDLR